MGLGCLSQLSGCKSAYSLTFSWPLSRHDRSNYWGDPKAELRACNDSCLYGNRLILCDC